MVSCFSKLVVEIPAVSSFEPLILLSCLFAGSGRSGMSCVVRRERTISTVYQGVDEGNRDPRVCEASAARQPRLNA